MLICLLINARCVLSDILNDQEQSQKSLRLELINGTQHEMYVCGGSDFSLSG